MPKAPLSSIKHYYKIIIFFLKIRKVHRFYLSESVCKDTNNYSTKYKINIFYHSAQKK